MTKHTKTMNLLEIFSKRYSKKKLKELIEQYSCTHENKSIVVIEAFDIHEVTEVICTKCKKVINEK